ncbi:MAG: hypothetical protein IJZ85_04375 [Lachnospiraceae bacterium]|nr:hypothetical protein [Lachnospiraceae bacterium]
MNTIKFPDKKSCLMIAHMGVSGLEPNNSIPAYIAAGNRTYYGIETDLRVTADGNFIVIHDSNTLKLTGQDFVVADTNYNVLRSLALIDTKMPKLSQNPALVLPSLEEYIYICKKYNKKCILELKGEFTHENLVNLVDRIQDTSYLENVVFITFSLEQIAYLRQMLPTQNMQYLVWDYSPDILKNLNQYSVDLDINIRNLTQEQIDEIHASGHRINVWTCDDIKKAEELVGWGIDFITTNILE